jgi:C-terminal processing protease CtpA/Prc
MKISRQPALLSLLFILFCIFSSVKNAGAQKMDGIEKERVKSMLKNVKNSIKDNYYDPTFGGMDLEARFKAAEEKLKTAETLGQALSVIAQAVVDLNDSHTRFSPPLRNAIIDYGWRMKMFGNKCFVTKVKEKSDAESKGLKLGDEILSVNGFRPTRSEMWKVIYYYQQLNPQVKMTLVVKTGNAESRQLEINSKVTQLKKLVNLTNTIDFNEATREGERLYGTEKFYFKEIGNTVIWKMPSFAFEPSQAEQIMSSSQIRNKQFLILDLRNNPGGYVVTLEKLVGYFFDKDIKIADLKGRKEMEPQKAKSQGDKVFSGKLVVLIDGNSASAAEIFARLMQLEKRGIVLGDVSAGAVMQSKGYPMDAGVDTSVAYGMNITNADVIMSDGKSLERVGVTPDEIILPTGEDLAARRDPVMARALEIFGIKMSSDEAGKIFPVEKEIERTSNTPILLREF